MPVRKTGTGINSLQGERHRWVNATEPGYREVPHQMTKEMIMKTRNIIKQATLIGVLGAMLALPAIAQPGPGGMGGARGLGGGRMGCRGAMDGGVCAQNAGPRGGGGGGQAIGRGAPGGRQGMRFNRQNTAGWNLMTPEERNAHRTKMFSAKTYDECKAIQAEQHQTMLARAKDQGVALPAVPLGRACDRMQARGFFQ